MRRGETPFADEFVRSFNRVRAMKRVSLSELSTQSGISKSYLSELSNAGHGLSLEYAMRIANALGQPIIAMVTAQRDAAKAERAP